MAAQEKPGCCVRSMRDDAPYSSHLLQFAEEAPKKLKIVLLIIKGNTGLVIF